MAALPVAIATAVMVLVGTVIVYAVRVSRANAVEVDRLVQAVGALAHRAEPMLAASSETADGEIRAWAAASGLRVTLIAADGRVHADSWTLPAYLGRLENHLGRPEVQAALHHEVGVARRRSVTTDRPTTYVARALGETGEPVGFLRLADDSRHEPWPWYAVLLALAAGAVAGSFAAEHSRRVHRAVAAKLVGWTDLPPGAAMEALATEATQRFAAERLKQGHQVDVLRAALDPLSLVGVDIDPINVACVATIGIHHQNVLWIVRQSIQNDRTGA